MSAIAESSFTSTSSSTRRTRSSLMLRSDAAEQDDDSILAPPRPTAPTSNDTTTSTASIPQNTTTTTTSSSQQPTRPQETLSKNVAGYAAKQASRVGFGKRTGPSFNISIAKRSLAPASQVSSHTPILSPQPSPAVPSSSAGSFQAPPPLKPASIAKPAEATTTSKTSPVVTMMDDNRPSKMPSSTMPPAAVMIASTTAPSNTNAPPKRRHHLPHCSRRRPRGPSSQKAQEEEADCGRRSGANTPQTSCAATAGTSHDMMSCGASPCTVTATHEFNSCFSFSDHLHSASGLTASNVGATFMDSSAAAENNQVTLEQINRRTPPQKKQMMMCENTNNNIALTPNSNTSIASWSSHCTECDGAWESAAAAATTTTAGAAFGGVSGGGDAECLSPQLTSSCADASSAAFPTSSSSAAASVATTATNTTSGDVKSKTMKKNTNTTSTTKTRKRRDEHMPLSIPSEKARIALESNARWYQSYTQKIRKQHQSSSPSSRNRKVSCCAESEDEPNQERGVSQLLFHRCNTAPIVSVAFNSSLSSHSTTVSANSTNGIAGTTPDRTEGMQSRQISDSDFIPQSPAPGTTGVTWGDAAHAAAFGDAPMTSDHGGFGQHHQPHHQPTMEESAMYRMSNECTASRLLPQLYLGGYSDTQYVSLMERFLVTRILSVAKECIPMDIEELDSSSTLKKEKVALEKIDLFSVTKSVVEACGVDTREQHQAFADSTNVVSCDHCVFGAQWIGPKDQAHAIRAVVAEWNAACAANPHQETNISSIVNPALVLLHPELATRVFLASDGHGSIFSTLHVPMVDHSDEDIGRWFEVCSDYIQDGACRGEATMVHCKMGISRSAATCMAYLMKYGIREKKVRDGFNFNLDTGGGRDLGYRGGRSLVKYRSMGTSSMLWNRTQTMGPGSPDTPTDALSTSNNNNNASPATKSRTASLYQQVPQPNPLIEAVSKVGGDSRVWEVATSVISDMFFNCPECASRGLVNVTYVNLHPLEAMQQYSRLSGASSLVSKSTSESFTGFVPVISNKKTVSDSLRRDLSAASTNYSLPSNNSNLPCDNNNNNGMGPRCRGSEDATNGDSEDAALVASYSTAFLSIPAIQPRALCVQRGRFGTAATHSASLSVYMSTWGALQPTTNNNNTDSEPVSMMVSPSAVADGAVTRKKSFPSTTSSQSSSTTTTPPPSIKAQYFHSHPTPMAKIREVADADMIVDTPPTSPTDPRDRLETMRDKRVNAAEDRLPCFTDYEEALSFVKRAKEEIGPNFGFSFALRELNTLYGFKDLLGSD